jgi:fluoride exporter
MPPFLWISLGAILGANLRYLIASAVSKTSVSLFPYSTLLINISGSFLLGAFMVWSTERAIVNPRYRLLFAIGFCGSYTTFSSYAFETFALLEQGQWGGFALNIILSNLLCLAAVVGGAVLARSV